MIVEIENPRPSCRPSLDYNEGKVLQGVAELVAYANMDDITHDGIYSLFDRYENGTRYPVEEKSFHASVNPSAEDTCTEEQVLEFISCLMAHLGYGKQPYLVYRHFDIEREHYHIVSLRVDGDGRKINNYYEKRRATAYMRENARRFGFSMAEKGSRVVTSDDLADSAPTARPLRFNMRKGVSSQMLGAYSVALGYDFDSFQQFSCILGDLGFRADRTEMDGRPQVALQGLDRSSKPVTETLSETDLGEPLYRRFLGAASANRKAHPRKAREKERLRSLVGFAFDLSRSEGHFVNILKNKRISVHFSKTVQEGEVFGITFVDHSTRTVFKASELRDVISVGKIREALASGKWRTEDRGYGRSACVKSSRATAKEEAVQLRDRQAGVVARVLRPVGQPKGASWSGRSREDEEQRKARRDAERSGAMDVSFEDRRYEEKLK